MRPIAVPLRSFSRQPASSTGHIWKPCHRLFRAHNSPLAANERTDPSPRRLDESLEPMDLSQALQQRYIAPFKAIYHKLTSKPSVKSVRGLGQKDAQVANSPPPLPSSIQEAWRAGLQGQHPGRFSRLRSKASTPVHAAPPAVCSASSTTPQIVSEEAKVQDTTRSSESRPREKSLLQTYLSLEKRSQRVISISVFVWALSGFVYFTWFVDPPLEPVPRVGSTSNRID